ncbi:FAD-dependent monooxygenase [Nocardioides nitrophenolicus]|uniref:FAD-dependent monooxygenase n=1 Tax=Nocardioides nitrophenolicus TaxID=60489 RepID=UPI001959DE52|nr:FAD-dependent monooxygenase [Nocardioides nitrophenolicus]MBM7520040.1 2-polyprenyl-6-methoxyphenol hydroxylase-like FAD-dependent oxidoreductase [Nocardioides nitrophenolicus]
MPKALVVGGGVAGPAVAALLTRIGWEAPVFEARTAPDPFEGLFLNVAVNGRRVLRTLGWEDRLLADAHPAAEMVMWSGRGKQLGVVPNGPAGRPDDGGVVVRRSWLHEVIRDGAEDAGVTVSYGRRLVDVRETGEGVLARFDDGSEEHGDVVVGADGVGSAVRRQVAPEVVPAFSGLLGSGGFARVPGLAPTPGRQHFVFGTRSFFGYLVRADGTVFWFANLTADEPPAAGIATSTDWLARLRELHADDPAPVPQILDATAGPITVYPIFRLPRVEPWWRGRAVLVGDAVHATSPSAGQGASMALEDAIVLASSLRADPDPAVAFTAYEDARRARAEALVAYAAGIDKQKRVARSRVAIAMRDLMLPIFLRKAGSDRRTDWIFDYDVPWVR